MLLCILYYIKKIFYSILYNYYVYTFSAKYTVQITIRVKCYKIEINVACNKMQHFI